MKTRVRKLLKIGLRRAQGGRAKRDVKHNFSEGENLGKQNWFYVFERRHLIKLASKGESTVVRLYGKQVAAGRRESKPQKKGR